VKDKPLKAYIAYANDEPVDGAILVMAHSWKEAKRLSYSWVMGELCVLYTEVTVQWIKNPENSILRSVNKEKYKNNIPHLVNNPISCKECFMWGLELDEDELCCNCGNY
jgi:hypothetical protein